MSFYRLSPLLSPCSCAASDFMCPHYSRSCTPLLSDEQIRQKKELQAQQGGEEPQTSNPFSRHHRRASSSAPSSNTPLPPTLAPASSVSFPLPPSPAVPPLYPNPNYPASGYPPASLSSLAPPVPDMHSRSQRTPRHTPAVAPVFPQENVMIPQQQQQQQQHQLQYGAYPYQQQPMAGAQLGLGQMPMQMQRMLSEDEQRTLAKQQQQAEMRSVVYTCLHVHRTRTHTSPVALLDNAHPHFGSRTRA